MSLGTLIGELRKKRGISLADFAEASKTDPSNLLAIEGGRREPGESVAPRLLNALHDASPLTDDEREAVKAARVVGILPGAA